MKSVTKLKHSDEDVKFWAEVYTELGITLEEIEREMAISHSTTYWCFVHRLPGIDYNLYKKAMDMMAYNKHNRGKRNK